MAARRQVRRSVVLPAPAADVWRALTDATLLRRWLAAEVELDARSGAGGRLREADGTQRVLWVDAAEPGRRLALRWWKPAAERPGGELSVLELELSADGDGTRLTVTETDLADHEHAPGEPSTVVPG